MKQHSKELKLVLLFQLGASIHQFSRLAESKLGISLVQWCLLQTLTDMPGTSALGLAKATGVHPSTLTQSLKRLQRKGYVFVGPCPKDSRRKVVSITRAGKSAVDDASDICLKWSSAISEIENELTRLRAFLLSQNDGLL